MVTFVYLPDCDWCFLAIQHETGFVSIRDAWDGLEIWEADSLEEAMDWLAQGAAGEA
jgi:hypothetical protein